MARRLIGLDIGTNAVTIAEVSAGNPPRLERFGQVALPRDAMREGEVVDDRALIDAISRLRSEVDVKKAPVRLGLASPRAVVRQVEMPSMSRDELASALKFQAGDLIPIPLDEAVLDFAILGEGTNAEGEPVMHVLLVAAHEAPTARLVSCVESAGLSVAAVDLLPLALIRALTHSAMGEEGTHAEGIVSFGGGVTAIAVHEGGIPRFVRVLGTGGRELTDAIAAELGMAVETAEALKRQIGQDNDELVGRARSAIERPLALLLDEVRSSFDYYRNQPGATRLERVVVTGGASQLPGITERLSTLVGLPAQPASPRQGLAIGDIRFPEFEYPRLDPYLPASVGLALGGAGVGIVVDLAPRERRRAKRSSGQGASGALKPVLAIVAGLIVVLGVPTFMAKQALSEKQDDHAAVEAHNDELQASIDEKADLKAQAAQVEAIDAQLTSLLATDVSWSRMLQDISKTMPGTVWLTSFSGQVTAPPPVAPAAPAPEADAEGEAESTPAPAAPVVPQGLQGDVTFEANGVTYPDVASWIRTVGDPNVYPALTGLWVTTATAADGETDATVGFSSTAKLTDAARSSR
ncbi:MAG: type IV pilus assembly protein PilM, partial [Acidimicrobiia bacterium]